MTRPITDMNHGSRTTTTEVIDGEMIVPDDTTAIGNVSLNSPGEQIDFDSTSIEYE